MKLAAKGIHGVQVMLGLALNAGQGPVPLQVLASRMNISDKYVEQHLIHLKAAGLVKSVRGARGGYLLAQPPADITLYDIVRALEGPILSPTITEYVTLRVWEGLGLAVTKYLESLTLASLLEEEARSKAA